MLISIINLNSKKDIFKVWHIDGNRLKGRPVIDFRESASSVRGQWFWKSAVPSRKDLKSQEREEVSNWQYSWSVQSIDKMDELHSEWKYMGASVKYADWHSWCSEQVFWDERFLCWVCIP